MLKKYRLFLEAQGLGLKTQKNYLSDLRCFFCWLRKSGKTNFWFSQTTIQSFKDDLICRHTPPATVNRRLSALRKFGEFLVAQKLLKENPAKDVKSLRGLRDWEIVLRKFRQALKDEGQKPATIKNYLSDVRQFLLFWLRENSKTQRANLI